MKIDPAGFSGISIRQDKPIIAIAEADERGRAALARKLRSDGYAVRVFGNGLDCLAALEAEPVDLALLAAGLPGLDGFDVLREIRQRQAYPVILMVDADGETDEVLALRMGADDVLRQPVRPRVAAERVRLRLRQGQEAGRMADANAVDVCADRILVRGPLEMDGARHVVTWRRAEVPLTATEFALLEALARRPGHVKTRQQLMDLAYSDQVYVDDRTIDSHIKRLRRKLRATDPDFAAIETLYGIGYRYSERVCR